MEKLAYSGQLVTAVDAGSPAETAGVHIGDRLLAIDGEPVLDIIDYEYLTAADTLALTIRGNSGAERVVCVRKEEYGPLGLSFPTSLMSKVRACKNRCVFCFVDQMPKGLRTSLSFKDDDWRMSFIMGNYITLTNVSDAEFDRILLRRVGPLYVSVHATSGAVRARMMKNPTAARILERLSALAERGLRFHAQIVLCPGLNDGDVLARSITDLVSLRPAAQSVAVVPVGLTKYREGLPKLRGFTRAEAETVIDFVEGVQKNCLAEHGTRFVFLADEWYVLANRALPPFTAYEDFPQIENGVGLLRRFEGELLDALSDRGPLPTKKRFSFAGGEAATPILSGALARLEPYGAAFDTFAVRNDFFGPGVNVAGLVTGQDLVAQLRGRLKTDILLIPGCMLRGREEVFLDDMALDKAEQLLNVRIVPVADGAELVNTVWME